MIENEDCLIFAVLELKLFLMLVSVLGKLLKVMVTLMTLSMGTTVAMRTQIESLNIEE